MFYPHVFWLLIVIAAFFKKGKKSKINYFYTKEFEIGDVLIFSSVKISTYRSYITNKICLLYISVYMHRRKKSFLIIEMKLRHCITLQKNT